MILCVVGYEDNIAKKAAEFGSKTYWSSGK